MFERAKTSLEQTKREEIDVGKVGRQGHPFTKEMDGKRPSRISRTGPQVEHEGRKPECWHRRGGERILLD